MMPGLAQTAGGLMMRSPTSNPNPRAPRGTTADQLAPVYAYPKWHGARGASCEEAAGTFRSVSSWHCRLR